MKAFREQVFDVIEQQPGRLQEVDGIGPKRADSIVVAWADQKAIREIMIVLHSHGVGTTGDAYIQDLRCRRHSRHLIGFRSADLIAAKLGIERTAMIRARAGIGYALSEAMDEGHCGLPRDQLLRWPPRCSKCQRDHRECAGDELQDGEVVADTVQLFSPGCIGLSVLLLPVEASPVVADAADGVLRRMAPQVDPPASAISPTTAA